MMLCNAKKLLVCMCCIPGLLALLYLTPERIKKHPLEQGIIEEIFDVFVIIPSLCFSYLTFSLLKRLRCVVNE